MILPLVLDAVTFSVGSKTILGPVSLSIERGLPTLVLGANGAGKSTLMKLMHGLIVPTSGRIAWGAGDVDVRRRQAMVFQRPVMLRRSSLANVQYPLKAAGVPRAEKVALAMLDDVGLGNVANRPARALSGGEQQRLAFARARAIDPEVIFLDEPTASLDPGAAREVERLVSVFAGAGGKAIMSTHNLGQARRLAGDVIFLHDGRVAERASAAQFFRNPQSVEARMFLRDELAQEQFPA